MKSALDLEEFYSPEANEDVAMVKQSLLKAAIAPAPQSADLLRKLLRWSQEMRSEKKRVVRMSRLHVELIVRFPELHQRLEPQGDEMTEHSLPDDLNHWPKEPHVLLGIPIDADERTIRRAYAALIRRYNPEHAPDEFRHIRSAFEAMQQRLQWRNLDFHVDELPNEMTISGDRSSDSMPSAELATSGPSLESRLNTAWELAKSGDWEAAITSLERLQQEFPLNEEIILRRYWIARLGWGTPGSPTPLEILNPGIEQHGLSGRIGQLYLRELELNTELLLADSTSRLMTPSRASMLEALARLRWRKAASQERWSLIQRDLGELEEPLLDQPRVWGSLQMVVLELGHAATHPIARELLEQACELFYALDVSSAELRYLADRADFWLALIDDINSVDCDPGVSPAADPELVNLIQRLRGCGSLEQREILLPLVKTWADDFDAALRDLDRFLKHAPRHLHELGTYLRLQLQQCDRSDELVGQDLMNALYQDISYNRRLIDVATGANESVFRKNVLAFCVEEFADCDDVLQALHYVLPHFTQSPSALVQPLWSDVPLRCLSHGYLLLWSQSR